MTLEEVLEKSGNLIIKGAKLNLKRLRKLASGSLYDSLSFNISNSELSFQMAEYGKYVDSGRKPDSKFAPPQAIEDWCKIKKINTKFAFVINRAIAENGIKPTYFFTQPFEEYTEDMDKMLDIYANNLVDEYLDMKEFITD